MAVGTPSFLGFAPGATGPSELHFATSGGAASAGLPIAANPSGVLDPSWGAVGATGGTGPAGPAGAAGAQGGVGATGPAGPAGAAGAQGGVGATGPAGPSGAPGATGPAGSASAQVVASEAIAPGAMGNAYNNGGVLNVQNADGSVQTKPCNCFVPNAIAQGATGTVTFSPGLITGLSGLTPGDAFLSVSAKGGVQSAGATGAAAGQTYQRIGEILTANSMIWRYEPPIFRN